MTAAQAIVFASVPILHRTPLSPSALLRPRPPFPATVNTIPRSSTRTGNHVLPSLSPFALPLLPIDPMNPAPSIVYLRLVDLLTEMQVQMVLEVSYTRVDAGNRPTNALALTLPVVVGVLIDPPMMAEGTMTMEGQYTRPNSGVPPMKQ